MIIAMKRDLELRMKIKIKTSITGAATKLLVSLCLALSAGLVQAASVKITYYHNDLLGSPVAATNEIGELKWRKSYKPYGEELETSDDTEKEFVGYTGHRLDKETGLVYAGARHYDPVIGRFYGNDPVGFTENNPMMFNRYAYANNNPYKYTDPDGETAQAVPAFVGGTIVCGPVCGVIAAAGVTIAGAYGASEVVKAYNESKESSGDGHASSSSDQGKSEFPAPGKPTAGDGFEEPKKPAKSADKSGRVKNPNGQGKGWKDKKGNVWVSTGGKAAHGGEHWDVQKPNGKHVNVYPGGKER